MHFAFANATNANVTAAMAGGRGIVARRVKEGAED